MKKLIPLFLILTLVVWIACSSDDDDNGTGGGDPVLTRVTVNSSVAAPAMTNVNHASWAATDATALPISNVNAPYFAPPKVAAFADSVFVKAIKAGGKLYLRFEWEDSDYSIERDHWIVSNVADFWLTHNEGVFHEDQIIVMFEGESDWDAWNWRALTTGEAKCAEDMSYDDTNLTVDDYNPAYTLAWENEVPGDNSRPRWIHRDTSDFTGDVMYITDTLPAIEGWGVFTYQIGQKVPGWVLLGSELPAAMKAESRWEVEAVHDYIHAISDTLGQYTLVLCRTLAGSSDDLDMTSLAEVKAQIGVTDDYLMHMAGSRRLFTPEFILEF